MSVVSYDSYVQGLPSGFASTAVVVPLTWNGTAYTVLSGGNFTLGPIVENVTYDPGSYICRVTFQLGVLPPLTVPRISWLVNGLQVMDWWPLQCSVVAEVGITYAQAQALVFDACTSQLSGLTLLSGSSGGTLAISDPTGALARISTTFDAAQNRTNVTLTPPQL